MFECGIKNLQQRFGGMFNYSHVRRFRLLNSSVWTSHGKGWLNTKHLQPGTFAPQRSQLFHLTFIRNNGPDVLTYNAMLSAYEKGKQWQRALALLWKVINVATVITFNTAISACEKAEKWQFAMSLGGQWFSWNLKLFCRDELTTCFFFRWFERDW